MDFGVAIFPTEYTMRPDELAREVESRGFESLWFPEHTHIPKSRMGIDPNGPPLPRHYWYCYDPFVALSFAAQATSTLKLATGICLVVERDPISTAKAIATLDHLSGGRFLFGIGGGWNAEEMANHGTEYKSRWRLLKERIEAMKAIWTQDEPSYHGDFVNFDPILSWPKPHQKPHPPILLGGGGPHALKRVVQYCDGWVPLAFRWEDPEGDIAQLRSLTDRKVTISPFMVLPKPEVVERFRKLGVDRVIFQLESEGRDRVLSALDDMTALFTR